MQKLDQLIARAQAILRASRHAVALTGAGVSTPSGIPDFRSPASGVWSDHDPFEVASLFAFRHRPEAFYEWIYPLAHKTLAAMPNAAHTALALLEKHGPLKALITQNIDMLHNRAGSGNVLEIHGHMRLMTCVRCYGEYEASVYLKTFLETGEVPYCHCGGVLKPNVILFGEQLPVRILSASKKQARSCDVMIVAGSSLEVAPAGDLPALAKSCGAQIIVVNQSETHVDEFADVVIHADVVDVLPQLAEPFQPVERA